MAALAGAASAPDWAAKATPLWGLLWCNILPSSTNRARRGRKTTGGCLDWVTTTSNLFCLDLWQRVWMAGAFRTVLLLVVVGYWSDIYGRQKMAGPPLYVYLFFFLFFWYATCWAQDLALHRSRHKVKLRLNPHLSFLTGWENEKAYLSAPVEVPDTMQLDFAPWLLGQVDIPLVKCSTCRTWYLGVHWFIIYGNLCGAQGCAGQETGTSVTVGWCTLRQHPFLWMVSCDL